MRKYINNSVSMSGRNNKCVVNGKTINVPSGATVSVSNGKVYVNGKEYVEDGLDKLEVVHLTVNIEGDARRVDSECEVVINGNVNGSIDSGMNVTVNGDVDGDISSGMSLTIKGNQTGSANSGMSMSIGTKVYK